MHSFRSITLPRTLRNSVARASFFFHPVVLPSLARSVALPRIIQVNYQCGRSPKLKAFLYFSTLSLQFCTSHPQFGNTVTLSSDNPEDKTLADCDFAQCCTALNTVDGGRISKKKRNPGKNEMSAHTYLKGFSCMST